MQARSYAFQFNHIWHHYLIIRHRVECCIIHAFVPSTGSTAGVVSRTTVVMSRQSAADRIRTLRALGAEQRLSNDFDLLFNVTPTYY